MAEANNREEIKEKDYAQTQLRVQLLREELSLVQSKIDMEIESFYKRHNHGVE